MPPKYQLCSKSTKNCKTGSLKPKIKAKVRKGSVRSLRSQIKRSGFNIDVSNASETIWLTCPSKQAEPPEKIYLRTSVPIKKLTKRNIDDTCLGRWRCDYCGKIENSYYLLQLHISTNCETGLSFNCEICDIEIKNFADFAVHHIEHEVNTKKECPICLCPNVNNIKEHVIVKSHVLTEIHGFKFPDNLFSRNNLKREPVANSNVDGCSQDFMDQDSGPDVKDSGFSCGPQLSVIDSMPDFKMEHNFALHPAGALSEQSITTRVIVNDSEDIVPLCDKNMEAQDKTGRMLPNGFQTNLVGFSLDSMVDYNIKQSDAFSEISKTDILRFDDLEDSVPSSNEDSISVDANDSFLSNGPRQYKTDLGPDFETESDNAVQKPKAYLDQSISVTLIDEDWKDKDPSSNEDSISLNANDSFLSYGPRPSRTDLVLDFETESDSAVQMSKAYPDQSISAAPIVEGSDVDTSNFVKTQNIEVNSAPVSMDTILPLIPNQSKQDNQNQEIGLKDLDKECIPQRHVQKECLSMAQSISPVQERLTLRRRETTNIYYELSDSDLDNSGNEVIKEKADESGGNYELDSKVIRTSEIVSDSRKESHVSAFREDGEWENKVFSCSFCGKTFKTKGHLNEHINTHTMEKVHTCTYCGKNFVRRSHLQDHERLHTNDRPFTCEFCGKTFRSSSQLNVHFRFHRHDKWYICEICGKSFFTSSSLKRHLKIHKNDSINYICEICGKSFLTSNLKRHLKIHKRDHINSPTEANLITAIDNDDKTSTYAVEENEVPNQNGMHQKKGFQCQICKKYLPTEYALRIHTSVHSKVYSCSLCPKSFTSKRKLLAHEKVHAGAVVFECPVCKKTLKAKSSLIDHIRIHNGERSFQCDICTRSFTKKSTLVTHMRIHSGERPFECQTCKKTFTTSSWLKAHERSHTDEDRFMCSLCERRFTTSSSLKVHMRSHTGACPFVCNYCGKAFTTSSSLRVHERSHSGLTPFKCRICKKAFTANGALKSHEKSHGSDFSDSFLCRFCDGSFKNLDDLKKHELTHQHKKRYHCKNCDEAFITMFELTRHVREDHGTEKFVTKDKEAADELVPCGPPDKIAVEEIEYV